MSLAILMKGIWSLMLALLIVCQNYDDIAVSGLKLNKGLLADKFRGVSRYLIKRNTTSINQSSIINQLTKSINQSNDWHSLHNTNVYKFDESDPDSYLQWDVSNLIEKTAAKINRLESLKRQVEEDKDVNMSDKEKVSHVKALKNLNDLYWYLNSQEMKFRKWLEDTKPVLEPKNQVQEEAVLALFELGSLR